MPGPDFGIRNEFDFNVAMDAHGIGHVPQTGLIGIQEFCLSIFKESWFSIVNLVHILAPEVKAHGVDVFIAFLIHVDGKGEGI